MEDQVKASKLSESAELIGSLGIQPVLAFCSKDVHEVIGSLLAERDTLARELAEAKQEIKMLNFCGPDTRRIATMAYIRGFSQSGEGYNAEIEPAFESQPEWSAQMVVEVMDVLTKSAEFRAPEVPATPQKGEIPA